LKESTEYKAEIFFAKNWKYIFWALIVVLILQLWGWNNITGEMKDLKQVVRENNDKVVLTTTDGRAIKVTKEPIKAEYLKAYAVSTFANGFIVGRANVTNNFEETKFMKPSDVIKNAPNLANIWTNFIRDDDKILKGKFLSYLNWLINAIATDKLPEFIAIQNYVVDKYEYEGNKFKIGISVTVNAQSYVLSLGKYVSSKGVITIEGEGYFDLSYSKDDNPYGMNMTDFKINMVTKGN
jgi:hypothetical protein